METLNASLHDSLNWSDAQFSDSEAQRLFSSAHFDVLVFVASKGGGSCPLQDRTPPSAPVDEQAVQTTTLEIRDQASFEAFFAVRPIFQERQEMFLGYTGTTDPVVLCHTADRPRQKGVPDVLVSAIIFYRLELA